MDPFSNFLEEFNFRTVLTNTPKSKSKTAQLSRSFPIPPKAPFWSRSSTAPVSVRNPAVSLVNSSERTPTQSKPREKPMKRATKSEPLLLGKQRYLTRVV